MHFQKSSSSSILNSSTEKDNRSYWIYLYTSLLMKEKFDYNIVKDMKIAYTKLLGNFGDYSLFTLFSCVDEHYYCYFYLFFF